MADRPGGTVTVGASGLVFGYATYLLTRGLFDRSGLELAVGVLVGVVWGSVLLTSLVPHYGVSWQAHLCGGIAGVVAAWVLRAKRAPQPGTPSPASYPAAGAGSSLEL